MRVVIALGSNVGERVAHLQAAVDALAVAGAGARVVAVSPVVETDPVGGPAQPDYLNAVVLADLPEGLDLWGLADRVERSRGRDRSARAVRHGPRPLDVDVVAVGERVSDDPRLTLPHPRAHERAFVLLPWAAIDPDASVPGRGPVCDLLAALPDTARAGVRPRPDLGLRMP